MKSYLTISELSKKIKGHTVLDNINLTVDSGKIYGFKGINGSGKTMLLRAILALIKTTGSIEIKGEPVTLSKPFPVSVGVLIENPSLITEFSAVKNLSLIASLQTDTTEKDIVDTLLLVGLDPTDTRKVKKYSLGMKQKLGLAQAFLGNNELLVLDEPTNALDSKSVAHLKIVLKNFAKEGKTILLTCHDAAFIDDVADEMFELEAGKLL